MICTLPMNERLAYLAGIFDGEGCVGLWNQRPKGKAASVTLQLRINMITPFAVQLLYETFGGALFANKPRAGKRRQTFTWVVYSRKAEACLRALLPYLREKLEQTEIALAFVELRSRRSVGNGRGLTAEEVVERNAVVQKLKDLKRAEYDPNTIH